MSAMKGEGIEGVLDQWVKLPRLHRLLPYESYDPTTHLFFNQDSTGFVLLASPIVGASLNDQQQMAQFFCQEGNLAEGTSLQFLLFASPHVGPHMAYWRRARQSPVFAQLAKRRSEFLEKKAYEDAEGLLVRDYKLIISYTVPGHITDAVEQKNLMGIRREFKAVLETMGIHSEDMDADTFINEVGSILNLDDSHEEGNDRTWPHRGQWNEHDSLNQQIVDTQKNFAIVENGLLLNDGKLLCRSYIPKISPKYWSLSNMDGFLGNMLESRQKIPCPFLIHYGMFVDSFQGQSRAKAYAKRESLEKAVTNGFSKYDPTVKAQYEESKELCEQIQMGERIVVTSLSTTIFSKPELIQENEQYLRAIWQDCGWVFQPTRYDHLPMLLSSLPMTWTLGQEKKGFNTKVVGFATALEKLGKAKKTITEEAQNLLPVVAEWKGQNAPGMPLVGRRGQLFFWSPFGAALLPGSTAQTDHTYNVSIAGQSGSGKSVFMNELMETILGVGGRVFVLDLGRSFKKTCNIQGGEHIEFDIRNPICLNPFSKVPEGNTPDDVVEREEMLSMIAPIVQVMAAPKMGTNDLDNSYVDQAIRDSWEKFGARSSIDTVRDFLLSRNELVSKNLGQALFSFSSSGTYGHFFNREANASFEKNLVVIETDHLRNYPNLMAVVVQMLIIQINQIMAKGDRKTPFLIIIDEAWKLLSGKSTGDFISEVSRTARKYKGGIVLGTQHLTDYFKKESPSATDAFNCSAWKCILYQEGDVITSLKTHDQLKGFVDTEYKEALLRSIHSKPPHYSEVAIFGPQIEGIVGRLRLDPFSRLLYSTNAEEYRLIEEYTQRGDPIETAIERVIAQQEGRPFVDQSQEKEETKGIQDAA